MEKDPRDLAREYCIDEYTDYIIYSYLARRERNPSLRAILEKLASDEKRHYEFWRRIAGGDCEATVGRMKLTVIAAMRRVLGLTFTLKWLERHEEDVIKAYKNYLKHLRGDDRKQLEQIIREEEEHENKLISSIEETIVKYLSFIVLGLADAIVEITGVHAGFLGVTSQTRMAGIAGLIVGVSAAISMASAAYLQAKSDPTREPLTSALMTGTGYIGAVAALAAPYFMTSSMLLAFAASMALGLTIVGVFSYYSAIVFDRSFLRELAESSALMFGTAAVSYVFGDFIGARFGLHH